MALKAIIPPGQTEITVNGLHQWDYGRKLEIHSTDLPPLVEVHFSCTGMETAVVRACSVIDGVAEVAIPDRCLEQSAPILAWIYKIDGTAGATTKTIILPVIARTRPQATASAPEAYTDKYTEAVTAMNELVKDVENAVKDTAAEVLEEVKGSLSLGEISVKRADNAGFADVADEADTAQTARYADEAGHATNDKNGNDITVTYTTREARRPQYKYFGGVPIPKNAWAPIGTLPEGYTLDDIAFLTLELQYAPSLGDRKFVVSALRCNPAWVSEPDSSPHIYFHCRGFRANVLDKKIEGNYVSSAEYCTVNAKLYASGNVVCIAFDDTQPSGWVYSNGEMFSPQGAINIFNECELVSTTFGFI